MDGKTIVQLFTVDGVVEKALFGLPEKENSIALKYCFEWNRKSGFNHSGFVHWRDHFSQSKIKKIVDEKEPKKSIVLSVNKRGDIISSHFFIYNPTSKKFRPIAPANLGAIIGAFSF